MLNVKQFREDVVRPVLEHLGLYSAAAENLMVGTALQESRLTYLRQLGGGPALGAFQMETATHDDIWANYLKFHPTVSARVKDYESAFPGAAGQLPANMNYACAMARVHYYRRPEPLPDADDIEGLGRYWKVHYNTAAGAGTAMQFVTNYRRSTS